MGLVFYLCGVKPAVTAVAGRLIVAIVSLLIFTINSLRIGGQELGK